MASLDVAPDLLSDPSGWIDGRVMARAWAILPTLARDPCFGLHAAERMPIGIYGPLELAVASSASVGEALSLLQRYYERVGVMTRLTILPRWDGALVVRAVPAGEPTAGHPQQIEHLFALVVSRVRALAIDLDVTRITVSFAHEGPEDGAEHRRVLCPEVRFRARHAEIVLGPGLAELPLRTAHPSLVAVLEQQGSSRELRPDRPTEELVRRAVEHALREGDASLATVASKLGRGPRTLQRELRAAGSTFAEVLERARREVSERLVARGELPFGEIAFLTGFARTSAFHRAFKRWTGTTPGAFRASRRQRR